MWRRVSLTIIIYVNCKDKKDISGEINAVRDDFNVGQTWLNLHETEELDPLM